MLEIGDQSQVQQLRQDQHGDGNFYRRACVLAGIETRRQDLYRDDAYQPHAVPEQRLCGLRHGVGSECTALEQRGDQCVGKHQQGQGAWQGQQQNQSQTPVEHARISVDIAARLRRRQLRDQHHTERYAKQRRRKLHQPIGIAQPRHCTHALMRRNLRVDHHRDLRDRHAEQCWRHLLEYPPNTRMRPRGANRRPTQPDVRQCTNAHQCRYLHRQLEHAPQHDAHRKCINRRKAPAPDLRCQQPRRRDRRQVQQYRRGGRHRKSLPGVEHSRRERDQRDESDVREHPARHDHGIIETGQARPDHPDNDRCAHDPRHAGD